MNNNCSSHSCEAHEHHSHEEQRVFKALYLLPYGHHPASDGKSILDGQGQAVADPASVCPDMAIGICALQPLEMIAQFSDGTFGYAHAHEVQIDSADYQSVEFHFDPDCEWSGVEGRRITERPVTVTAAWAGDASIKASAAITVVPIKALVWMPDSYAISADGSCFIDSRGQKTEVLPDRGTLKKGEKLALLAVGKYGDGRYQVMSRSELEFACVDDWVSVDYCADDDLYIVKALAASSEPAEIMLTAMASEDLLSSYFVSVV
ncbi:hypothetical protein IJT17_09700 [bacterium]|nr:hypothetical protein [bacterium]